MELLESMSLSIGPNCRGIGSELKRVFGYHEALTTEIFLYSGEEEFERYRRIELT